MKTSVSEPWCRSAGPDMYHDDTPSGSGAQVLTRTQVKDEKLGQVFAHIWAHIIGFSKQKLNHDRYKKKTLDGAPPRKQTKHENDLITSSGRQQGFFSFFFFCYIFFDTRWWMRRLGAAAGGEVTEQNIVTEGFAIVSFRDCVIYERTLSSQKELKTVKFPEWRQFI